MAERHHQREADDRDRRLEQRPGPERVRGAGADIAFHQPEAGIMPMPRQLRSTG